MLLVGSGQSLPNIWAIIWVLYMMSTFQTWSNVDVTSSPHNMLLVGSGQSLPNIWAIIWVYVNMPDMEQCWWDFINKPKQASTITRPIQKIRNWVVTLPSGIPGWNSSRPIHQANHSIIPTMPIQCSIITERSYLRWSQEVKSSQTFQDHPTVTAASSSL